MLIILERGTRLYEVYARLICDSCITGYCLETLCLPIIALGHLYSWLFISPHYIFWSSSLSVMTVLAEYQFLSPYPTLHSVAEGILLPHCFFYFGCADFDRHWGRILWLAWRYRRLMGADLSVNSPCWHIFFLSVNSPCWHIFDNHRWLLSSWL